mgnify:CR=1 FL=1
MITLTLTDSKTESVLTFNAIDPESTENILRALMQLPKRNAELEKLVGNILKDS